MKYVKIIFIVLILLLKTKAHAIGSIDTIDVVHFLATENIPLFAAGSYVKGAVYFDNGFNLTSTSTLEFGSLGIASGTIGLNNATLKLTNDLYLGNSAVIAGPGFIDLNGYSIILSDLTIIPSRTFIRGFNGNNGIEGNGNILNLASVITKPGETFKMNNLLFAGLYQTQVNMPIFQADAVSINNCNIQSKSNPGIDANFSDILYICGNCKFIGINKRIICGDIIMGSTNPYNLIVTEKIALRVTGDIIGNTFDVPSKIILNDARIEFTSPTAQIKGIQLIINGACSLSSVAPLTIGDGSTGDCEIIINPGATLSIDEHTTIIDNSIK